MNLEVNVEHEDVLVISFYHAVIQERKIDIRSGAGRVIEHQEDHYFVNR